MKNTLKLHWIEFSISHTKLFVIVYIAPVVTIFMLGYYFDNAIVRNVVSLTHTFNWFSALIIAIVTFSTVGRFLSEISNYILSGFRHIFYWFCLLIYKLSGLLRRFNLVKNFRKRLHNSLTTEDVHLNPIRKEEFLDKHPYIRNWYMSIYVYSTALQSAFGASILLYFFYAGTAKIPVGLLLILFFFATYMAKRHLIEADRSLFDMMNAS